MWKITTLFAASAAVALSAQAGMTATQKVERVVVEEAADGTVSVQLLPAETVVPGEQLAYTLEWANDNEADVDNVVLKVPVPEEVTFIEGSATTTGVSVSYSTDNGATFAARDALTVERDGKTLPATTEDITDIRWAFEGAVEKNSEGTLVFKALLN